MNNRIPLAIAAAALCLSANAKQISVQQAETVARKYIATQSSQKKLRHAGMQATAPYYAFNSGKGFVVVSGDDSLTELVCYSDHGAFDSENIPAPLQEWLDGYADYVKAVQNGTAKAVRAETSADPTIIVPPLVAAKWDQFEPYNGMTPSGCATGCVATALAEVMHYHKWPDTGVGSNTYTHSTYGEISVDFSQSTYDWDNMLAEYIEGAYTEEQANAIAKLMLDCGVALNMKYRPSSSSALDYDYAKCAKFFKYNVAITSRCDYNTADVIKLVTSELDKGRPFIIGAQSFEGGHTFVADGYDSNNFLHINWGWGGYYDGYFNINYLDPEYADLGGGSGALDRGQAFFFFKPLRNGETPEDSFAMSFNSCYGIACASASFAKTEPAPFTLTNIHNIGSFDFTGNLALGVFDSNDNLVARSTNTEQDRTDEHPLKRGYYINSTVDYPVDLSTLADGIYTARGIYRLAADGDDAEWKKFSSRSKFTITISGDNVSVTADECRLALAKAITMSGDPVLGEKVRFNTSIVNESEVTVDGYINYHIAKKSDGSTVTSGEATAIIYDGSTYDTNIGVTLSESEFEVGETYVFCLDSVTTDDDIPVTLANDYDGVEFTIPEAGVDAVTDNAVKVYPNPAADVVRTTVIADRIAVYSISGALVAEAADTDSLNVAGLATSCYIVAVTVNGSTTRHQLIKN